MLGLVDDLLGLGDHERPGLSQVREPLDEVAVGEGLQLGQPALLFGGNAGLMLGFSWASSSGVAPARASLSEGNIGAP